MFLTFVPRSRSPSLSFVLLTSDESSLPQDNFSLSGGFRPLAKLVVCCVMIRGRHRGLPVAIDRAVRPSYHSSLSTVERIPILLFCYLSRSCFRMNFFKRTRRSGRNKMSSDGDDLGSSLFLPTDPRSLDLCLTYLLSSQLPLAFYPSETTPPSAAAATPPSPPRFALNPPNPSSLPPLKLPEIPPSTTTMNPLPHQYIPLPPRPTIIILQQQRRRSSPNGKAPSDEESTKEA